MTLIFRAAKVHPGLRLDKLTFEELECNNQLQVAFYPLILKFLLSTSRVKKVNPEKKNKNL